MSEAVLVLHVAWLHFISKSKQLMMQNIWHQVKGRQMLPLFPCLSGFGHREWIRLPKTPSPPTRLKIYTIYWIGAKIPKCMQLDQVGIKSVIVLVNKGRWQYHIDCCVLILSVLLGHQLIVWNVNDAADGSSDWWLKFQLINCFISFPNSDQISPECTLFFQWY